MNHLETVWQAADVGPSVSHVHGQFLASEREPVDRQLAEFSGQRGGKPQSALPTW